LLEIQSGESALDYLENPNALSLSLSLSRSEPRPSARCAGGESRKRNIKSAGEEGGLEKVKYSGRQSRLVARHVAGLKNAAADERRGGAAF